MYKHQLRSPHFDVMKCGYRVGAIIAGCYQTDLTLAEAAIAGGNDLPAIDVERDGRATGNRRQCIDGSWLRIYG